MMGIEEAFEGIQDIVDPSCEKTPEELVEIVRVLHADALAARKVRAQARDRVRRFREKNAVSTSDVIISDEEEAESVE